MLKPLTASLVATLPFAASYGKVPDISALAASHSKEAPIPLHLKKHLPSEWSSLKNANTKGAISWGKENTKLSAEPTGYLISNAFHSNSCGGELSYKFATGTGVCFVGVTNNTAAGSVYYDFGGVYGDYFYINQGIWDSLDCTGTPTITTFPMPNSCLQDDEDTGLSYLYSYVVGSSPWTEYDPGFMFQFYDSSEHCSTGGIGGTFAYYPLNSCIVSDNGESFTFTACDADKGVYTTTSFSDGECQNSVVTYTVDLQTCVYQDSTGHELDINTYSTYACI